MNLVLRRSVVGLIDVLQSRRLVQWLGNRPGWALQTFFKHIGHIQNHSLAGYQNELLQDELLHKRYLYAVTRGWIPNKYRSWQGRFGNLYKSGANISWFYALIRELKPNRVIETGTAAGSMTSLILAAMARNQSGELISIDLPAQKGKNTMDWSLPVGQQPGLLIPEEYKTRWELRVGDAKDLLVPALREKPCDVFIHDSLHTYEHMFWEYVTAYVNMNNNSIIISDDTFWNKAWCDFTYNFKLRRFQDLSNPNISVTIIRHLSEPERYALS